VNTVAGLLSSSLTLAGIYALAALGFVIIYRATRVFNFAQGEFMMVGAYACYACLATFRLPVVAAVIFALVAGAVTGLLVYLIAIRSMTGQPLFAIIIVTMGVSIFMRAAVGFIWGPVARYAPLPNAGVTIQLPAGVVISLYDLLAIGIAVVVCASFMAFFRFTTVGLQMRATAENPRLAGNRGVNVQMIFALAWALAGMSAVIGGILYAGRTSFSPAISALGLQAFPAALVGGFDSVGGAIIGALLVAVAETVATSIWGPATQDVVAFGILLLILLVRPYGLFGAKEVGRV
jgi:branched-chain amino acid transport system permease protein